MKRAGVVSIFGLANYGNRLLSYTMIIRIIAKLIVVGEVEQ